MKKKQKIKSHKKKRREGNKAAHGNNIKNKFFYMPVQKK